MGNLPHPFIDEESVWQVLEDNKSPSGARIREILAKGREMRGLAQDEVAALMRVSDPELLSELFNTARDVKDNIYGSRLVIFAPLYISNLCANECSYCAFRALNSRVRRRALTQEEIAAETRALVTSGHKRVLLVAGEAYPKQGFSYVLDAIDTVYGVTVGKGEIRRVNVNVAPLTSEEFKALAERRIGTYQIFQETYHQETYHRVHLRGRKTDYEWRVEAIDRAMASGINDVGIGVLFGLFDWRFEVLAMLQHIRHLEEKFGVGPHTISVPRMEPATGSDVASHPPYPVSDVDFRKLVAILRLAVPYTGIIMSTRESRSIRQESFALGVSQISAGSRTNPGGYSEQEQEDGSQFSLGDHRGLDEVIQDVARLGYIPSFCTGCYRLGRVGKDFMDLARPGDIKEHCDPNGLSTFLEYLLDYASEETRQVGEGAIQRALAGMTGSAGLTAARLMEQVRRGRRDVFC